MLKIFYIYENQKEMGLYSVDSMDWYTSSSKEIKKCVVEPIYLSTIKALPGIIDKLSKQGYEFVKIDKLLSQKN